MKNCRSRKIQNGAGRKQKKYGTTSGLNVLIHGPPRNSNGGGKFTEPSRTKMSNNATIRAGYGTNTVASTR